MRFNAETAPQREARDNNPMPDGTYPVEVATATEIDNKSGTGRYLELVLQVASGAYKGRRLWARYTTSHSTSDKAVEIGLGQIGEASRALSMPVWDHESELVGCVGECRVGRQKDNDQYNEIRGWVVPDATKGQPAYNRARQAQGAEQHDVSRKGGQLRQAVASAPPSPPHPADFDDDLPF